MGVDAALGRTFHAEDALGRNPVAVISYSYWKSRFGGEPSVLGKIIQVDGAPLTIIGVHQRLQSLLRCSLKLLVPRRS